METYKYKEYQQEYYIKNSAKVKARVAKYRKTIVSKIAEYHKDYRARNKEKLKAYKKAYYQKNKKELNAKSLIFLKNNVHAKLASYLRRRLKSALRRNTKGGSAIKHLGCSIIELKSYLESKFKPGMSWENQGKWHIDHIKPLSSFDLTNEGDVKLACNYSNLQPLWAADNISKGAKCQENLQKKI